MANKREVEIFSAGCPVCREAVLMVENMACDSCHVRIVDMNDPAVADRAHRLGIRAVPAVVIDGKLADCCTGSGIDEAALRSAGIGQPL